MATPTPEQLAALPPEFLAEENRNALLNTSIAFIVLSTVAYAAFLISRLTLAARNGWETWTLYPLSFLLNLGLCVIGILIILIGGGGRHVAVFLLTDPSVITTYLKLQTATESIYMASITVPKVNILLLYSRIFTGKKTLIMTWIVLAVVVLHWVASGVIAVFTICIPFAFKWDKTIPDGRCADLIASYRYISIPNIITDLAIVLLPLRTLSQLQLAKTEKVGVFLTILTGGLGIVTSVIRFVGFYTTDLPSDVTWYSAETMLYTIIESSAYFICSCLPGTRPLLRVIYQKVGLSGLAARVSARSAGSQKSRSMPSYNLGNLGGSHKASAFSSRQMQSGDNSGFIHIEDCIDIETTSASRSGRYAR